MCCYRLDRLSRDFADMNDKFTSLGIGYTSVTESFIDAPTPMGRMMIQVILGFAQCERETSQERVKHFFSEARSLGRFLGGPTPYGYRCEKSKLYADPQTAPFVERIFKMLDEGKVSSIHDLADTLKLERKYVRYTLRLAFLSTRVIRAIMQGQEPDGLSLAALRRLTTANWSEQEKFLGLIKQQESC